MCGSAEILAVPNHSFQYFQFYQTKTLSTVRYSKKTADLQGSFLTGVAGSVGAVPEWRGAGGCCCDMVPLSGDLLTQCQLSLYEEEAPHSHSDLEYKKNQKQLITFRVFCPIFCISHLLRSHIIPITGQGCILTEFRVTGPGNGF